MCHDANTVADYIAGNNVMKWACPICGRNETLHNYKLCTHRTGTLMIWTDLEGTDPCGLWLKSDHIKQCHWIKSEIVTRGYQHVTGIFMSTTRH